MAHHLLEATSAADRSTRRVSHGAGLPAPMTRLFGRDDAIEEVCELLTSARLVTLTGPGGIGKTQLALAVAHRLAGRFTDGVLLVELATVTESGSRSTNHCDRVRAVGGNIRVTCTALTAFHRGSRSAACPRQRRAPARRRTRDRGAAGGVRAVADPGDKSISAPSAWRARLRCINARVSARPAVVVAHEAR